MPEQSMPTALEVARSIGWIDAMNPDIEFDSADWSRVDTTGEVRLEGRKGDYFVTATVRITSVEIHYDDSDAYDDDEEDDDA